MNLNFKVPAIYWKGLVFALSNNFYPYIKFNLNQNRLELSLYFKYKVTSTWNLICIHLLSKSKRYQHDYPTFPAYSLLLDYKAALLQTSQFLHEPSIGVRSFLFASSNSFEFKPRTSTLSVYEHTVVQQSAIAKNILTLWYLLNKQNCSPVLAVNEKNVAYK